MKVDVAETDVLPMEAIAPKVIGLRIAFVNVFAITHEDGNWTLIDTGVPHAASRITEWAGKHFATAPSAIVLTHGHFDHAGSVEELAQLWDLPVYAHPEEFPYLSGQLEYPAPNWRAGGGMMSLMSPALPRGPVNVSARLRALPERGGKLTADVLPGWSALHTPGHTPRSCFLLPRGRCDASCRRRILHDQTGKLF